MSIATSVAEVCLDGPVLLTIGTFDGFHRGHHFLLEQASARAVEHGYHLVVVTFDPCPAVVLRPSIGRYQLTTATQKLRLLRQVGPTLVLLLKFTPALASLSADQFLDSMEGRLQLREIWMGEDFRFGRDREGGLELLVERGGRDGFSLHVVARKNDDQSTISSSRVRSQLGIGAVNELIPLLGRPFALEVPLSASRVVGPEHTTLRFVPEPYLALPSPGWYAALIDGLPWGRSAAAVLVEDTPDAALLICTDHRTSTPAEIEFIDRLEAPSEGEALWRSIARTQQWTRPVYRPAGRL